MAGRPFARRHAPSACLNGVDPGSGSRCPRREQHPPPVRPFALYADGARRPRADRGVRERCESAPRTRRRPPPRDRASPRARRRPLHGLSRQLLAESLLLASAGAALGTALAWWSRGLLLALRPFGNTSVVFDLPLDARVLTFTIAVAVMTSLLFGLAPALRATRVDLTSEFQGGTRLPGRRGRSRLSQGADGRSDRTLSRSPRHDRTVHADAEPSSGGRRRASTVTTSFCLPIDATSAGYRTRAVRRSSQPPASAPRAGARRARGAFSRIPLLSRVRAEQHHHHPRPSAAAGCGRGREHERRLRRISLRRWSCRLCSAAASPIRMTRRRRPVAVVNQTLVKKYFGRENPIGRRLVFTLGPAGSFAADIVGVAGDAKYTDLRAPVPPTIYLPARAAARRHREFRAANRGGRIRPRVFPSIRAAVREIDPDASHARSPHAG